jgi:hypothetical protein
LTQSQYYPSVIDYFLETTQDDVQRDLLAEEKAERICTTEGAEAVHDTTASQFLSMGLELENQQ